MSASGIQLIFCQSLGKCLYVLMHRKGHSTYQYNQYYRPNIVSAFRKYLFYKMPKMSMTTLLSTSDYDGGPAHFGTLQYIALRTCGGTGGAGPEMRLLFIKSKSFLVTMGQLLVKKKTCLYFQTGQVNQLRSSKSHPV